MSVDWSDNYLTPFDEGYDELYGDRDDKIIDHFALTRLQSYYRAHASISAPAHRLLSEARSLIDSHPTPAFVSACSAIEIGLKSLVMRPIVFGLIHEESLANAVTELALNNSGWDKLKNALFRILKEYARIDLAEFKRDGATRPLWEEVKTEWKRRNRVIHRGEEVSICTAELSIELASAVIEMIFPALLRGIGLADQVPPNLRGAR